MRVPCEFLQEDEHKLADGRMEKIDAEGDLTQGLQQGIFQAVDGILRHGCQQDIPIKHIAYVVIAKGDIQEAVRFDDGDRIKERQQGH